MAGVEGKRRKQNQREMSPPNTLCPFIKHGVMNENKSLFPGAMHSLPKHLPEGFSGLEKKKKKAGLGVWRSFIYVLVTSESCTCMQKASGKNWVRTGISAALCDKQVLSAANTHVEAKHPGRN